MKNPWKIYVTFRSDYSVWRVVTAIENHVLNREDNNSGEIIFRNSRSQLLSSLFKAALYAVPFEGTRLAFANSRPTLGEATAVPE